MNKNDKVIGICNSYTYQGLGVVKIDGFPIFVDQVIMGEEVEVLITSVKKTYGYGKLINIIQPSNHRITPICPIYMKCGGCQLQHMDQEEQANFKQAQVQDVMKRIGNVNVPVQPILTMDNGYNYRNKGQIPVAIQDEKVVCGFYRIHSNDIINMDYCFIQSEMINQIINTMKSLLNQYQVGHLFKHILIKHGFKSNEIMVVWIVKQRKIAYQDEMIEQLVQKFPTIKSIILNINKREDNVIVGEKEYIIYGNGNITDSLDNLQFKISSKSFYQVNPNQTQVLYKKALELAKIKKSETFVDLYCGIGTISLFLAQAAKKVIGIEIVEEAIEDAKMNAELNNIKNVEFICSNASEGANQLIENKTKVDGVIVDPPRKGCDLYTIDAIVALAPKRIVYISCDPSTLARDVKIFEEKGYNCEHIQPVDMFPQTYHIESVVLLERR